MAKKIERKMPKPVEDDLEILHPHQTIVIDGVKVEVREYGFVQGLRLRPLANPLIIDLTALLAKGTLPLEDVIDIIAAHDETVLQLIAESTGTDVDWLKRLNGADGDLLLLTWWVVNANFFIRSVQRRRADKLTAERLGDGGISTPPSSPTATTPPTSATTQSDS